jgi:hypothetical protein
MDGRDPERVLSRGLQARTAARRLPEPPEAVCGIARGGASAGARAKARAGARSGARARAADLGWAAALAVCLACFLAFGRAEGELARRLDDPSISRAIGEALSASNLCALGLRLDAGSQ